MYGSTHTHFESQYDTGNDKALMLRRFLANGAKKIAVTEHGAFSSYEDLRDLTASMRKKGANIKKVLSEQEPLEADSIPASADFIESFSWAKPVLSEKELELIKNNPLQAKRLALGLDGFDVIPGVEGYFGENHAHLILIAKDYEGYVSLCHVISESNEVLRDSGKKTGKPTITLENLKKHIAKGHVICTSACIAGPFGQMFGLEKANLEEKIEELETDMSSSGYPALKEFVEYYEDQDKMAKALKVRKKELAEAEKAIKKYNDDTLMRHLEERQKVADEILAWITENTDKYEENLAKISALGKAKYAARATKLENYKAERNELLKKESAGDTEFEALNLLSELEDVFGDDFYFEIQNHGLLKEADIYSRIVRFAYRADHPKFIASNDVHVGARKSDPEYQDMLKRRNVIQFTRFNTYWEEGEDDKEYVIKSDAELKEALLKIIPDVEYIETISKESIIDSAIANIEGVLSECAVEFPKNENHYPKFCEDEAAEFERRVREGIKERFPNGFPDERYAKRLEYELGVIKTMGYSGYHLIVADYLEYGRLLGYLPTEEEIKNAPLSVKELKQYIKDRKYPMVGYNIGPGRGSAVGSLCCYALGITDVDPIPYNLLFERFLNVERVSMPDIDSDFRTDIRGRVIDYCRAKYGAECICQIMTKAYGAPKGNLRLAARYLGTKAYVEATGEVLEETESVTAEELENATAETLSAKEKNERLKSHMRLWYDRADALAKQYDELCDFPEEENLTKQDAEIVSLAKTLDGVFTGYGQHAAGTIISGDDLRDILPLMWNTKKGSMETQCTMAQAEAKGLLKMDFLGLQNLDIITNIIRNPSVGCLNKFKNSKYAKNLVDGKLDTTLQNYPFRDEMLKDMDIYQSIFWTGLTQGVFQFESEGMKKMLMEFKPESFEDIILLVAAYRPGPMQYLPEIIAQKQYDDQQAKKPWALKEKIEKPKHSINIENETLKSILAPTYGCIIYQEQVMQLFQNLAGYSLGGADLVRRAMSKKHLEDLIPEREAFVYGDPARHIEGCVKKQGLSPEEANLLFDQMMDFAAYAFNKSHATAYAMVAMFTAYLKKYHTADFFRDSLNAVKALDEIPAFVHEMPAFHLTFAGPSIINSGNDFSVEGEMGDVVRFGLRHIKGFSNQDGVTRRNTVQEFIEANPNISLKVIEKYAQLGLFAGAWARDIRNGRCINNRHECLRWIKENGELFQKYQEQIARIQKLEEERGRLEESPEGKTPEGQKEIHKITGQIASWTEKRKVSAALLNERIRNDYTTRKMVTENTADILENRKWETELLSVPFDIRSSKEALKQNKTPRTFADLNISKDANGGSNTVRIPAIILSVSEAKKTKKSGKLYYDVSLMDRESHMIVRRFDAKPDVLDGEFSITINECRYFTCEMRNYKPLITTQARQTYLPLDADTKEKAEAIARGGKRGSICLGGNRYVNTYTTPAQEEEEKER